MLDNGIDTVVADVGVVAFSSLLKVSGEAATMHWMNNNAIANCSVNSDKNDILLTVRIL